MLTIRRAAAADQPQLMAIYRTAQEYMLQTGNPTQWGRSYPSPELIRSDIAQGICRVLSDEAGIHGVFALLDTPEPTYSQAQALVDAYKAIETAFVDRFLEKVEDENNEQ